MSAEVGCWEASSAAAHAPRKNSPSGNLSLTMKAFVAEKEVGRLDGLECTEEAQIRSQVVRHSLPRRLRVWFVRGYRTNTIIRVPLWRSGKPRICQCMRP